MQNAMRATVLAYGYGESDIKALKTACTQLDIRLRRVSEEDCAQPVGALLGVTARRGPETERAVVPGRMLVLAGLSSRQLEAFLTTLRTLRAAPSLKAVLTEHNADWPAPVLYAALAQEHRAMNGPA